MRSTTTIVLLVVSVGILILLLYSQTAALREQRRQVQELNAKLESKTASLDLEEKCAKQAHEAFNINGFEKDETAVLLSHYNEKLSKCFVQIESHDAKTIPRTIYENKTVAVLSRARSMPSTLGAATRSKSTGRYRHSCAR